MIERTFHIPIEDDELRMMAVKDHLMFSDMAIVAFREHISMRQNGASQLFSGLNLKHLFKRKDIFSEISGHEDVKWLLTSELNSDQPVHILLVGKPGLGKTQFLEVMKVAK